MLPITFYGNQKQPSIDNIAPLPKRTITFLTFLGSATLVRGGLLCVFDECTGLTKNTSRKPRKSPKRFGSTNGEKNNWCKFNKCLKFNSHLVGGWTNPSETYYIVALDHLPKDRGLKKYKKWNHHPVIDSNFGRSCVLDLKDWDL